MAQALAIVAVVPLTFLSVVLGELVPKTIALRSPSKIAVLGARWIVLADKVFSPLVLLLEKATKFVLYFLPNKKDVQTDQTAAVEIDHLSRHTQQYVLNLVSAEGRRVKDIMIPWNQVTSISALDTSEQVTNSVLNSGHTRFPVTQENKVIGLLHTKEFIALIATDRSNWKSLIRPISFVSDTDQALRILHLMQQKRSHMMIVLDSKNAPVGIITLSDVIEEFIGTIYDEDDDGRIHRILATTRVRPSIPIRW